MTEQSHTAAQCIKDSASIYSAQLTEHAHISIQVIKGVHSIEADHADSVGALERGGPAQVSLVPFATRW